MRDWLKKGVLLFALASFYMASHSALRNHRVVNPWTDARPSIVRSLPPMVHKALAGEFKGLVADFMILDAGAQLGTELVRTPDGSYQVVEKEYDWQAITNLITRSQDLDPSFQQTYMLAQGWLPWDASMVAETQVILEKAAANRPWDWRPIHLIGFNTYYFLNRPGEAGKIFLQAAQVPDAPPFLAILGGRLAHKGGETAAAIGLMKVMLADKNESDTGYQDMVDRLHALEGVLVLQMAVQRYEAQYGKKPHSLDDLTTVGILHSLPPNPYNLPYCLDSRGIIQFDMPNCRTAGH